MDRIADILPRRGTETWPEARRARELARKRAAWAVLVPSRSPLLRRDLAWYESADAVAKMIPLLLLLLLLLRQQQAGGEPGSDDNFSEEVMKDGALQRRDVDDVDMMHMIDGISDVDAFSGGSPSDVQNLPIRGLLMRAELAYNSQHKDEVRNLLILANKKLMTTMTRRMFTEKDADIDAIITRIKALNKAVFDEKTAAKYECAFKWYDQKLQDLGACGTPRLFQVNDTCWINSTLNGILMSPLLTSIYSKTMISDTDPPALKHLHSILRDASQSGQPSITHDELENAAHCVKKFTGNSTLNTTTGYVVSDDTTSYAFGIFHSLNPDNFAAIEMYDDTPRSDKPRLNVLKTYHPMSQPNQFNIMNLYIPKEEDKTAHLVVPTDDGTMILSIASKTAAEYIVSRPILIVDHTSDNLGKFVCHGNTLIIKDADGNRTTYARQFFLLDLLGVPSLHSIVGFKCNEKYYLYDSNQNMPLRFNWATRSVEDLIRLFNYIYVYGTPSITFHDESVQAVVYCQTSSQAGGRRRCPKHK